MYRTTYINPPYPQESYLSILCRYKDHLGLDGSSASRHLFGRVIRKFNPNQALNVELLIKRLCENSFFNNADTIIEKHTLIPFLRPFLPANELNRIIQLMKGSFENPFRSKQLSIKQKTLRYCPICVEVDKEKYGETYWHLNHAIPSWPICPEHNCCLFELDQSQISNTNIWYIADNLVKENKPVVYGNEIQKSINSDINSIFSGNSPVDKVSFLEKLKDEGFIKNDRFTKGFRYEVKRLLLKDGNCYSKEIISFNNSAHYKKLLNNWSPTVPIYLLVLKYYYSRFESNFKIHSKETTNECDCRCGESKYKLLKKHKKVSGRKKDGLEIFCPACGFRYNINTTNNKVIVLDYGWKIINQIKEARKTGKLYREISADLLINVEMVKKLSKLKNYKSYQKKFEAKLFAKRRLYLTAAERTTKFVGIVNWLRINDPEWLEKNRSNFKRKNFTRINASDNLILREIKSRYIMLCKENPNYRFSKTKLIGKDLGRINGTRYQELLPETQKFINDNVESWFGFKTRQISIFIESVIKSNGDLEGITEQVIYHRFIGNRKSLKPLEVKKLKSFVRDLLKG